MKRQLFVRKGVSIVSMIGLLCVSLFTFCAKENPTTPEKQDPTYSFSGFIIDGNTGKALSGATVLYFKANGDSQTVKTGVDGGFDIPGIPYGNRSFFFKYISTGTDTTKYTTAAVTIEGNDWENFVYKGLGAGITTAADTVVGGIRNVAGPVKLYPLSGSLSGTVITQLHDRANLNPIKNAVVKVTFDPAANLDKQGNNDAVIGSNVEVGPSTFEVLTDSTGKFTITGLPVSGDDNEKVKIKVVSVTSGGIDWTMTGAVVNGMNVELASNQSVPVGAIILNPIVKIALSDLDNNFKTGVVNPEHTFEVTYSDDLDTVSYAVLSYTDNVGVKRNVPATVTVAAKKMTVNPITSLINETAYTLNVYAYGKTGQSTTDNFNVTAAGGGLADVVTSNVLTATKAPVFNFGVKTPITFTYADSITGNPSVQITNNDVLVTTSADGKTLTVTPRSIWKNGIINVNLVLKNGTAVRFSTDLNIENALSFVSSNVCDFNVNPAVAKNGLTLNSDIVFFTNKDLTTADVILKEGGAGGTTIPATVSLGEGDLKKVVIEPINTLKPATQYTVTITAGNAQGESKSQTISFTTTAAQFYSVSDNVRIGNDPTMPRLDFAPNANIVIRMNRKVVSATVVLSGVNVKTVVSNDSIVIDPETILVEGTAYNIDVNAVDSFGQAVQGRFVTGLVPRALVIVMASNIVSADGNAVTNASKDISPWFKLSIAPVAANIKAVITNPSVDAVVSVNGDTLVVNPVSDFAFDANPTITITGEAVDGNYISIIKSFTVMKKPVVSLVASNVVNSNYEGLTGIAENVELWYKLSRAPSASTVSGTVNGNKAVVRVAGDTIFLKATENLSNGVVVPVTLNGLDVSGISFSFTSTGASAGTSVDWKAFTVREALFPVASNTWGPMGKGDNAKNFAFYDTMWVKFSQPLSTDLSTIVWSTPVAATDVVVKADLTTPNSVAWVSGDTLFVLPDNRANITWNKKVGFGVKVKTALGQASGINDFIVETPELNLFVKATNTLDAFGERRENFGLRDTVFVVSSVPIDSIHDVYSLPGGATVLPDVAAGALKSSVRLSASGDTIFYVPSAKLTSETVYKLDFKVHLKNAPVSLLNDHVLEISWKTNAGVKISANNVMANATTFRPFKVIGDTLAVTFTKAIDTAFNAPTPFKINGFVDNITKVWSSDLKTVRIINRDTLTARTYSIAQNDMTTNNNAWDNTITFNVTCADGEEKSALGGENRFIGKMAIKTEYKPALIASNAVEGHTTLDAIANTETKKDTFALTGRPTLVFSRAIDTATIKKDSVNQYSNFIKVLPVAAPVVSVQFLLTFSADAKTITIVPVDTLRAATQYNIVITNIPVVGLKSANYFTGTGTDIASSILNTYDFKTVPAADVIISALTTTIVVDTQPASAVVLGNRYAYSPGTGLGAQTEGSFKVLIKKTGWGAKYADSVDGYQFRARRSEGAGWSDWYILTTEAGVGAAYDPFDPEVNSVKRYFSYTVDLTADAAINTAMLVPDADGNGANYANGNSLLNGATTVQLEARAFNNLSVGKSYAQWSSAIGFGDNVAPGDSDFCQTSVSINLQNLGTASLSSNGVNNFTWNRTAAPNNFADSSRYFDVVFTEDMDISTAPSVSFYAGTVASPSNTISKHSSSRWIDARTYRIFVKAMAGSNYFTEGWYFRVTVNGMKDYAGNILQTSGNSGTPALANNTLHTAVAGIAQGNVAVGVGNGVTGIYAIPNL